MAQRPFVAFFKELGLEVTVGTPVDLGMAKVQGTSLIRNTHPPRITIGP